MKTAIIQSNYIPWKGYFDLINSVDTFVLYDSVQFTKNDWRNRNKLIIGGKTNWVTIPVRHQNLDQKICDTTVANPKWAVKHWRTIAQAYSKAPYFNEYADTLEEIYREMGSETLLSRINLKLIMTISEFLNIDTKILTDDQFDLPEDRIDKLIDICKKTNATTYLSGPAASDYLDESRFLEHGIKVEWIDYGHYRPYTQLSDDFDHFVSVLDLLFCHGPDFNKYLER